MSKNNGEKTTFDKLPPERRRAIQAKGGRARGEAIRKRKALRDVVLDLLSRPPEKPDGKPTPDTIRAARKAIETMCIDKRQFVDDVMLNVPPRNKETASKHGARKSRCNYDYYIQQVERFFDMAIDHGTLIRKYETHPEQKGMWRITFDTSK